MKSLSIVLGFLEQCSGTLLPYSYKLHAIVKDVIHVDSLLTFCSQHKASKLTVATNLNRTGNGKTSCACLNSIIVRYDKVATT